MTTQKQYYLTEGGLAKLQSELDEALSIRRTEAAERVQRAMEMGSTEDNEYEDAKNQQAFVEGRILTLENIIRSAVLIPADEAPSEFIKIGSRVTVVTDGGSKETYQIVGSAEANAKERRISNESPVGRALLGHNVGDEVEVVVPAGLRRLTVTKIG